MKPTKAFALLLFTLSVHGNGFSQEAEQTTDCYDSALTQHDMNHCAVKTADSAEAELNQVFADIKQKYHDDEKFLTALIAAQQAWFKQRDLDLALHFPHQDETGYYGSVFPMCYTSLREVLTRQRIAFLKQWLVGVEEGDVCAGSIPNKLSLQ